MIKLKIDASAGLIEVEGDDSFVREVYQDYKNSFFISRKPHERISQDPAILPGDKKVIGDARKKVAKPLVRGTQAYSHDLASKLDAGSIKLTDFYKERHPTSGFEQNAIFVYFLEKVLKKPGVTVDDVFTCYKFLDKPNPTALRQSLIDTSNKKQWLNTSSMDDIKISSKGERLVDFDLKKAPEKPQKMKVVTIQEFLVPFPDFHRWEEKKQVDYLSFYLQGDNMGGRLWYSASDIEDLYTEIPLTPYGRIARYLSEESLKPRGGKYVRKPAGYVLSKHRHDDIQNSFVKNPRKVSISSTLNGLKNKIKDGGEVSFLTETIDCYEIGATRASIVMMWTLAIAHIRNLILAKHLSSFNLEIQTWNISHPKNQLNIISSYDDFGEIPDHRFIELAKSSGVINKDKKHILEEKLKIRNMAGHPTTAKIAQSKADEFVDDLALNILV